MKNKNTIKYWPSQASMEVLIMKHYLIQRGFRYIGDSATAETSPQFDKEVMKKVKSLEQVEAFRSLNMPVPSFYSYLGKKEAIQEGVYSFYGLFPDEEEKSPDTLRGGFRVEPQAVEHRNIKRNLPSELLHELSFERLGVLLENVKEFYFEPLSNPNYANTQFNHHLTAEDVITLSRMEKGEKLELEKLRSKDADEGQRIMLKSLEQRLIRSPLPLVVQARWNVYTLSLEATKGMYHAVVDRKYLP